MNENVKNFNLTPSQEIIRTQSRSFNSKKRLSGSCYGTFFPFSEIPEINTDPYLNLQRRNILTNSAYSSTHNSSHNSTRESTRGSRKSSRNQSSAASDVEDENFSKEIIEEDDKNEEIDDSPIIVNKNSISNFFNLSINDEFLSKKPFKTEIRSQHETKNLIHVNNSKSESQNPPVIILVALDSPKKRLYKEVDYSIIRPKPFNYRDYNGSAFADPPEDIIKAIEITKAQIKHPELMKQEMKEGSIFCEICQVYLNNDKEAENHRKSEIHMKNLNNYDIDQMMSEINDFCAKIDEKRELKHQLKQQQLNLNSGLNLSSDQSSFQSPKSDKRRRKHITIESSTLENENNEIKFSSDSEKIEKEKLEFERIENEKREAERIEKEKLEFERKEKAKREAERIEREKREFERKEKAKREAERIEREKQEFERKEKEKIKKMKELEKVHKMEEQNSFYQNLLLLQARNQPKKQEEENGDKKDDISQQIQVLNQLRVEREETKKTQNGIEKTELQIQNEDKADQQYKNDEGNEADQQLENETKVNQNEKETNQKQIIIETEVSQNKTSINQEQITNETEINQNETAINQEQITNETETNQNETATNQEQITNKTDINQEQITNETETNQNETDISQDQITNEAEINQNKTDINQESITNEAGTNQEQIISEIEINYEHIQNENNSDHRNQSETTHQIQTDNLANHHHIQKLFEQQFQIEADVEEEQTTNEQSQFNYSYTYDRNKIEVNEANYVNIPRPDFHNIFSEKPTTKLQFNQEKSLVMPPHLSYVYQQHLHPDYNKSPIPVDPSSILSSPPRIRHKINIYSNEGLIQPRINIDSLVQLSPQQQVIQYLRETNAMKEIIQQPSPINSDSMKSSEAEWLTDTSAPSSEMDHFDNYENEIEGEFFGYDDFEEDSFNSDYLSTNDSNAYSSSSNFNDESHKNDTKKNEEEEDDNNDNNEDNNYQYNQDPDEFFL